MEINHDFDFIKNPLNLKELAKRYNLIVAQKQLSEWQKVCIDGQYDLYFLTISFSPPRFKNHDKAVELLQQRIKKFYAEILENKIIKIKLFKEKTRPDFTLSRLRGFV